MRTLNNEIIVHRNESFTIDKIIVNKDGSPFVISKELKNPFFLITISTTRYDQRDRYVLNYWIDLNDAHNKMPRFSSTVCIDLKSLKTVEGVIKYNNFSDITNFPLSAYIDGVERTINADDCVFYVTDGENVQYKYYDNGWKDYVCRLTLPISQDVTKDWIEQSYVYSIKLVSGELSSSDGARIEQFDSVITILPVTKLTVLSSIKGGF